MRYSAIIYLLFLLACGSNRSEMITTLMDEQKLLKDSANSITDKIGDYTRRGVYDSAEAEISQLGAVHARLKRVQLSIDKLSTMK